ncbi:hypothetical protein E2C01_012769 [Portunus trituberculatus]|uniref:Uncharacterized protein n=1 Tax=Portunus trituberculatus TaxID=210409 RepID=A0A5B7DFB1_PORTR|nr:hypothetical protein [Portunus trituberculatus]
MLGYIFTLRSVYDQTILLTLGRDYRSQKINGHSLHYSNSHMSF